MPADERGILQTDASAPLIAVTGFRNSGKTTAVEGIVRELSRRGYRVGTFKHCHHGYDLDRPGKDSWRHRQAGSAGTVVMGPDGFVLLGAPVSQPHPQRLAAWLLPDADLVLLEGFHWLPLPRIEILSRDGSSRKAHPDGEALARLPFRFTPDAIVRLCDRLEERYLKRPAAVSGPEALLGRG